MKEQSIQQKKKKFRASKKWKDFRDRKRNEQINDPVTGNKLTRMSNLHHLDLSEEHYEDISNDDNFIFLGNFTHKVVHWLGGNTRWNSEKWQKRLEMLREICEKMDKLNS